MRTTTLWLRTTVAIVMTWVATIMWSADYETLRTRAERYFSQREWASASAMYDLMIEQQPTIAANYCRGIVSAGMRGDTLSQMSLMRRSMKAHIAFDSIFMGVKRVSISVQEESLYEEFLITVKHGEPWLSRSIDRYLLDYYSFRNDAPKMIEYSRRMLNGLPDNLKFLSLLGEGYMLNGQYAEAVDTYKQILKVSPQHYDTLLKLGVYYESIASESDAARKEAIKYLRQARDIKPTPYINTTIERLATKK